MTDQQESGGGVAEEIDRAAAWFDDATEESGIDFVHKNGDSEVKPFPSANGSGLGAIDYDLDGLPDLFFATATDFPVDIPNSTDRDRLYRNLGNMKFVDVSTETGVDFAGYSVGVTVGDYDADGFPDLYVSCYGANLLYRNQGDGSFTRVEQWTGTGDTEWATSPMFFDADNDGQLDIYICNYGYWNLEINQECRENGIRLYCSPKVIKACRDTFLRNQGNGSFQDDTDVAGLGERAGRAQGVVAADMNDDGFIDIYLGNDLNANSYFVNDGKGKFADDTELSGVAYDNRGNPQAGMGVDAADVNRDGRFDLFVTNFKNEYNSLYESFGPGYYNEVSAARGVSLDSMPYVAWGTVFADFNLDGWLDLYVVNGHVDDNRVEIGEDAPYRNPDLVWVNEQGRFRCLKEAAGEPLSQEHCSRALVLVDLDRDGDEDVVIGHQNDRPSVVRNLVKDARNDVAEATSGESIQIQFVGTRANRSGFGVKYSHEADGKPYFDQITSGGSYLSSHDLMTTFAVPATTESLSINVTFPGGQPFEIAGLVPGGRYIVIESGDEDEAPSLHRIDQIQ